jgi:ABC-type amino acid transport substrate-binding protein
MAAVLAGFLVLALALAGCSTSRSRAATTALPAELKIGITPNYPPLALKEDGKLKGVEVDFAQLLGKQLGVKTTLVELRWEDLVPALLDGRIDVIMSGMSITAGRTEYVDFTVPYMTVGQMALVRKVELPRRREQEAIDQPDVRVGVIQNTTGDYWARRTLKSSTVMGFTSVDEGVEALRGDRIDFFISDAPTIWQITSRHSENADLAGIYRPLTTEYLAWAVRQDDNALRHQLNTTVLLWEQNGQLADILDDWISTRRVTLQLK